MVRELSPLHLDYLVEIYHAEVIETNGQSRFISSAELATRLGSAQSSVNRIVDKLSKLDLVEYKPYVGVKLNQSGRAIVHPIIRKQGIIEAFLIQIFQFERHELSCEAKQLCHRVSERVLNRMWEFSDEPKQSPFGEPIDVQMTDCAKEIILADTMANQCYRIERILTRQPDRLHYLCALKLLPGTPLQILHKAPFNGPLQIQLEQEYRILGYELCNMITVSEQDQ